MTLDYTIQSPAERASFVERLIAETPPENLTPQYIEILSNYIIFAQTKEERKQKNILTDNRMVTINKRETSYQGLVEKFENGEDGIYNLINEGRSLLLTQKHSITPRDVAEMPPLQALREVIESIKKQEKNARGKRKYLLKKQLIETYQDQYVVKEAYRPAMQPGNVIKSFAHSNFEENITINEKRRTGERWSPIILQSRPSFRIVVQLFCAKRGKLWKFYF